MSSPEISPTHNPNEYNGPGSTSWDEFWDSPRSAIVEVNYSDITPVPLDKQPPTYVRVADKNLCVTALNKVCF